MEKMNESQMHGTYCVIITRNLSVFYRKKLYGVKDLYANNKGQ